MTGKQGGTGWISQSLERMGQLRANRWRQTAAEILRDYALILLGSALLAISMHLFFIPHQLVAGGLSGTAQIISSFTGWPIGTLTFALNVPLFILGWFQLVVRNSQMKLLSTARAIEVLDKMTGRSWQAWFEKYLYGTETPKVD